MKYQCDMIRDLLPLYCDEACSGGSRKIVEEHLEECEPCSVILRKLQNKNCDDCLHQEKEMIIGSYVKNIKKKAAAVIGGIVALTLFICLIVNLATGRTLDWFFIVLSSLGLLLSVTAVPLLAADHKRLWTFGGFTVSLQVLLLVCCLYNGGDWFLTACAGTLLGIAVVILPFVIKEIPLTGFWAHNKGVILLGTDTVLLYLLIVVCGIYGRSADYWKPAFLITTACVLFCWAFFAVIRYLKAGGLAKAGICVLLTGAFEAVSNGFIEWAIDGTLHFRILGARLGSWSSDELVNANLDLIILITCCVIGGILLLAGRFKQKRNDHR